MRAELEKVGYEILSIEDEEEHQGFDLEIWRPGTADGETRVRLGYAYLQSIEFKKLTQEGGTLQGSTGLDYCTADPVNFTDNMFCIY